MKTIKVQPLTHEAFAPFGQFYNYAKPEGHALCGELHQFFPDRLVADSNTRVGYSPIIVKKPERMIITQQEYHTTTWEMILPLDDDMILHCAPASAGAISGLNWKIEPQLETVFGFVEFIIHIIISISWQDFAKSIGAKQIFS